MVGVKSFYPPFCAEVEDCSRGFVENGCTISGLVCSSPQLFYPLLLLYVLNTQRAVLAYLITNPHKTQPSYGMLTNGSEFLFVKLLWDSKPLYGTSRLFAMRNPGDLYEVLKILKHLCQLI